MPLLAGLSEAVRRRRLLLPIQAYVDESGVTGTDRVLVLAAFIGSAERWRDFSSAWKDCLNASPAIQFLKMNEAARLSGQFRGWSETERDNKLRALAQVIKRFPPKLATHITVHLPAFNRFRKAVPAPAPVADAYFFAFDVIITMIAKDAFTLGEKGEAEVVFDKHLIFGPRATFWYPMVREAIVKGEPHLNSVMPASPIFRDDLEFLSLQASDMLAWLLRNHPRFGWLMGELTSTVKMSDRAHVFDNSSLKRSTALAVSMRHEYTSEWTSKWKQEMGVSDKMLFGRRKKKK